MKSELWYETVTVGQPKGKMKKQLKLHELFTSKPPAAAKPNPVAATLPSTSSVILVRNSNVSLKFLTSVVTSFQLLTWTRSLYVGHLEFDHCWLFIISNTFRSTGPATTRSRCYKYDCETRAAYR